MIRATLLLLACFVVRAASFHVVAVNAALRRITALRSFHPQMAGLGKVCDDTFEELIIAQSHVMPVLVCFSAEWCRPCKVVEPLLRGLHEKGEVHVMKADHASTKALQASARKQGRRFEVTVLPTVILWQKGKAVETMVGRFSATKLDAFVADAVRSAEPVGVLHGVVKPARPLDSLMKTMSSKPEADPALKIERLLEPRPTGSRVVCRGGVCRVVPVNRDAAAR
jgi:thioredoxin-like negative regulator of GroEL